MGKTGHCHKYILLTIAGTILVLLILEIVLFISGRCLIFSRRGPGPDQSNIIKIACIGDSHTFGVGTSKQYSYPAQLEKLLNYNNPGLRFELINLGIPGSNTRRQLRELESFFNKGNPELIIMLTGSNNDISEITNWRDTRIPQDIKYWLSNLRSIRFLRQLFYLIFKSRPQTTPEIPIIEPIYNDYINFHLNRIQELCRHKGTKLILISYYNYSDKTVSGFCVKNKIPYLDFTGDFKLLFESYGKTAYLSPDMSHMNHLGYKFLAERLYERLFLTQENLGLKINPLTKKIHDKTFYRDIKNVRQAIELEKAKIKELKNPGGRPSKEYPFELIHLGHIYTEIGADESARRSYMMALTLSGYSNNNTIVSPIINWYLRKGLEGKALEICDKILSHNPENDIAKYYRRKLSTKE